MPTRLDEWRKSFGPTAVPTGSFDVTGADNTSSVQLSAAQPKSDATHAAWQTLESQKGTPTPEMQAKGWSGNISQKRLHKSLSNIMADPTVDFTPRHTTVETPTLRWEDLNRAERAHITQHMKTLGITGKSVTDMAGAHLDASLSRHIAGGADPRTATTTLPGRDWYLNEGSELANRAKKQGSGPIETIDAAAIISPATPWQNSKGTKINADIALKLANTADVNNATPLTITPEQVRHLQSDADARPKSHNAQEVNKGTNFGDWEGTKPINERSAKEIATIGSHSNPTTEKTMVVPRKGKNVVLPRTNFAADIYGAGAKPEPTLAYIAETKGRREVASAIDVLRGNITAEQALPQSSPKPRAFRANLQAPYDHPEIRTIDRWDQRQLMGVELGSSLPKIPKQIASETELNKNGTGPKMVTPAGIRPEMLNLIKEQGANAFLQYHAAKASVARGLPISSEAQSTGWVYRKGMTEGFGQFGDARPEDPQTKKERLINVQQFDAKVLGSRTAAQRYATKKVT